LGLLYTFVPSKAELKRYKGDYRANLRYCLGKGIDLTIDRCERLRAPVKVTICQIDRCERLKAEVKEDFSQIDRCERLRAGVK